MTNLQIFVPSEMVLTVNEEPYFGKSDVKVFIRKRKNKSCLTLDLDLVFSSFLQKHDPNNVKIWCDVYVLKYSFLICAKYKK